MKPTVCLILPWLLAAVISGCTLSDERTPMALVGQATFLSDTGKGIQASYFANGTVSLDFANGDRLVLPVAPSGSGARYASAHAEWWEHQGEATYSVDGRTVFVGRVRK